MGSRATLRRCCLLSSALEMCECRQKRADAQRLEGCGAAELDYPVAEKAVCRRYPPTEAKCDSFAPNKNLLLS